VRDLVQEVTNGVVELELEQIVPLLREALDGGTEPAALLQAMTEGMGKVGELFQEGEYFLADLVLAAEAMKEGLAVLEPVLAGESREEKGAVVVCTVKGDIHDIGKNLVASMLGSVGFHVVDLGVDVHEDKVVAAVREHRAVAVALSVLMTPMVPSVSAVVSALTAAGLRDGVKIAIGGACTTPELATKLGVDAMGRDPFEAVEIFESFSKAAASTS